MSEEILVNVTPLETRVAVVDHGVLQDVQIERAANRGIVGNIYIGKVVRVLPGMQAAFVDIGEERTSFIHVADVYPLDEEGMESRGRSPAISRRARRAWRGESGRPAWGCQRYRLRSLRAAVRGLHGGRRCAAPAAERV